MPAAPAGSVSAQRDAASAIRPADDRRGTGRPNCETATLQIGSAHRPPQYSYVVLSAPGGRASAGDGVIGPGGRDIATLTQTSRRSNVHLSRDCGVTRDGGVA